MNCTLHGRGQLVLPKKIRDAIRASPGDIFRVTVEDGVRVILDRLPRPAHKPHKVRIIHRPGKHPVGDTGRVITQDAVDKLLAEFP